MIGAGVATLGALCAVTALTACERTPPAPRVTAPATDTGVTGAAPVAPGGAAPVSPVDAAHVTVVVATADRDASMQPSNLPVTLTWDLTRSGDTLHVAYHVHNTTSATVFLLDRLVVPDAQGLHAAFDRVIVREGDTAGVVAFSRAYVRPERGTGGIYVPVAQRLEPGKTVDGEADVPLPITAWHNFSKASPLQITPTHAYLEIGYLTEQDQWVQINLADGTQLSGPAHPFVDRQQLVRSDTRAIP